MHDEWEWDGCTLSLWSGCFISPKSPCVLATSSSSSTENAASRIEDLGSLKLVGIWGCNSSSRILLRAPTWRSYDLPDRSFPREKASTETTWPNLKWENYTRQTLIKWVRNPVWVIGSHRDGKRNVIPTALSSFSLDSTWMINAPPSGSKALGLT